MRTHPRTETTAKKKRHRQRQDEKSQNRHGYRVPRFKQRQSNILHRTDGAYAALAIEPEISQGKQRQAHESRARSLSINQENRNRNASCKHSHIHVLVNERSACGSGCQRQFVSALKIRWRKALLSQGNRADQKQDKHRETERRVKAWPSGSILRSAGRS